MEWNFWYKFAHKGKFWGSTEKVEYSCTTTNLPLCRHQNCFENYTQLHSVSQTSSFQTVTKTDRQTKTSHFLVYSRCATHDPHHTVMVIEEVRTIFVPLPSDFF